ncbi:MAG: hypothetical protein GYB64_16060 [Chloroflexi bacterium]|nr:hypothetical protein [Chloroflexota bacterium]
MSDDKILALNPDPDKTGVNVDRVKYEQIKTAMLAALDEEGEIPFKRLSEEVEARLNSPFKGSVGWYTTTVKLDLEARGLIERVPGNKNQVVRLKGDYG